MCVRMCILLALVLALFIFEPFNKSKCFAEASAEILPLEHVVRTYVCCGGLRYVRYMLHGTSDK